MKKVNYVCPFCGKSDEVYLLTQKSNMEIKHQLVEYEEKILKCKACEEEFEDGEMVNDNLIAARDAYRKNNNLLTSSEIVQIRKKYSLSQLDFSLVLGWGEVTITRYESKVIQDGTYDIVMRMSNDNPYFMLKMLEENKNNFSEEKYEKIRNNIIACIDIDEININQIKNQYVVFKEPSDQNGYTILDVEKLNNIIGIVLSKVNFMYKVRFMKSLWYIDELYFEKTGKSATGLVYLHRDMGALPICHDEILSLPAVKSELEYYDNGNMGYKLSVSNSFEAHKIPEILEEIIDEVVEKFNYKSEKAIVEYMHKEKAYTETKEMEIIPFLKEYKLNNFES